MYIIRLLLFLGIFISANADILVTTPNGLIRGRQEYSQRGISFYAFQEVPFAKPPVGDLRFKERRCRYGPADNWEGVLDTVKNRKVCVSQGVVDDPALEETEDCLYLNVYTPRYPSSNESLPVIFFIYGGGFVVGYATFDEIGPHYMMEHDVIVVTANYRVGLMGFLSTEDESIPGNFGLKDQHLAFKWVQENIKAFGGNPARVTIMGHSAGSASVAYQLMSKKNQGLFWGGVMLSGSSLSPWSYQRNARKYAYMMAKSLNSSIDENTPSREVRDLFLRVSANDLKHASWKLPAFEDQLISGFMFAPVIEPEGEDALITEPMYSALDNGHMLQVPIMIGISSEERIWDAANATSFKALLETYDNNVTKFVNDDMHLTDQTLREEVGNAIRKVYVDGLIQDNFGRAVKFFSDTSFARGIMQHALLQSEYSEVYFYEFSYYGPDFAGWRPTIAGADKINHADIDPYLWVKNNVSNLDTFTKDDVLASERLRILVTNFAKRLYPCSDYTDILGVEYWPTVKPKNFQYMNINNTLEVQRDLKQDVHPKMVEIYTKYAITPLDTF
ncbi:juvenile hormone esterase [Diabrotica virgifera virgifera]|uniref:Carboxylic ester hydrolase n=1 Tax=Diabrotica virgifera virgifera TaxID=50390 RepID=A0ABM5JP96_DIAVI|nr:juvenile hormone esterase [Diabrotica virgifera virgifera]